MALRKLCFFTMLTTIIAFLDVRKVERSNQGI